MNTNVAHVQQPEVETLANSAQLSLRTVASLVRYFVEQESEHSAREVLAPGGVSLEQGRRASDWISVEQLVAILACAFERLGRSEGAFVKACGYRARDAFGPFAYVTWAASPGAIMEVAVRASEFFSHVSSGRVIERGPGRIVLRHTSRVRETRLICLSRHGVMGSVPTIWGMPRARVDDRKCLAWGDDCCEYVITWQEPRTYLWTALAAVLGFGTAAGLALAARVATLSLMALPIAAAIGGYIVDEELRRRGRLAQVAELRDALTLLSREADQARREYSAVGERQRKRLAEVEAELDESAANVHRVFTELATDGREHGLLRAVTNGIPPLRVLRTNTDAVRDAYDNSATLSPAMIDQQVDAVRQLEEVLSSLSEFAWGRTDAPNLRLGREDLPRFRARLTRRVAALAFGSTVRAEVAADEPQIIARTVYTDTALLDLVLDSILTRTVEAEASGRIDIELAIEQDDLLISIEDGGGGLTNDGEEQLLQTITRVLEMLRAKIEIGRSSRGGSRLTVHVPLEYERARVLCRSEIVVRSG